MNYRVDDEQVAWTIARERYLIRCYEAPGVYQQSEGSTVRPLCLPSFSLPEGVDGGLVGPMRVVADHVEHFGRPVPHKVTVTEDGGVHFYWFPKTGSRAHGVIEVADYGRSAAIVDGSGEVVSFDVSTPSGFDEFFEAVTRVA